MLTCLERLKEVDLIWSKAMQPKHRFIVWLANQNKVLTKKRLQRLHIPVADNICYLCDEGKAKNPQHLFVECAWISEVRQGLSNWSGIYITNKGSHNSCSG